MLVVGIPFPSVKDTKVGGLCGHKQFNMHLKCAVVSLELAPPKRQGKGHDRHPLSVSEGHKGVWGYAKACWFCGGISWKGARQSLVYGSLMRLSGAVVLVT